MDDRFAGGPVRVFGLRLGRAAPALSVVATELLARRLGLARARVDASHAGDAATTTAADAAIAGPAVGDPAAANSPDRAAAPEPADRAVADRLLDEAPGERGDREDRRHLEDGARQVCAVRPVGRGEDDDRDLPEVDAVGALADPAHRPAADDRPEPRRPGGPARTTASTVASERTTKPPR